MYGGAATVTSEIAIDTIEKYLHELNSALLCFPEVAILQLVHLIKQVWSRGGTIYTAGNGGSSSVASHVVNDLTKMSRQAEFGSVRCHCLSDNTPTVTAWANDDGFQNVFSKQVDDIISDQDIVIALSGSGASPNIIKLVYAAKLRRATTIGITGNTDNTLSKIADIPIIIASSNMQVLEDMFSIVMHLVVLTAIEKIREACRGFGKAC